MSNNHDKHADDHGHHELGFWQKYIFSTDHKVIGIQYGITALVFLFFGFSLMMAMRWSIAHPGEPIPVFGFLIKLLLGSDNASAQFANNIMTGTLYNSFGAMHGTIMVFLAVVPLAFGAYGNYVTPLQVGAPDMAFPRLNMVSYHTYWPGGLIMLISFFVPGGAAKSGWTSYSPLASIADHGQGIWHIFNGQTLWLLGMVMLITSSLFGSVNLIVTIVQLRVKGLTWFRLPFFTWAQFITAFLLLLAFPPLESAGIMQLMDRLAGTSFFLPSGLYVGGQALEVSGGGSPLLWQHLFWFLAHPEVYVLILPAVGIVAEIIACNTRKPLWGYKSLVFAALFLGFISFSVWAHHMYLTGMGTKVSTFFQLTTVIISIPSVIILTALMISLWGGSIRFNSAMLFATAFLPMFGLGGLTGIPLAFNALDLYLHDTYYVIGHFHYVVAPGTIFALFAGIYHWYPKFSGRMMSEFLGKLHFWPSFVCMNLIFLPMFIQGMAGMHRRWYDGGASYELSQAFIPLFQPLIPVFNAFLEAFGKNPIEGIRAIDLNLVMSWGAWLLALAQVPFIINVLGAWIFGRKAGDNPWGCTTLEWATPTPPPHGNFLKEPVVYRGPYEYSVPGADKDFTPQDEPPKS
ncbi:MAG: cbb3-type cytochrome c oxidase subunit I [Candidatus Methylacidiphilales bacterium]|nr:cbb3-type cytochrome c oxidase subunit I [Candidatus Methylacidiphilales bacterium]